MNLDDVLTDDGLQDPGYLFILFNQDPDRKALRFGQWVWNKYGKMGKTCPELFYADSNAARKMLERHYYETRWCHHA